MTKFSANLGFLWADLPLPDAIRAAYKAGFAAVECHWPYDVPSSEVKAALDETGLPMLGLNTSRGDVGKGEMGLSALPDRVEEARAAIDQACAYAHEVDAKNIHAMAGFTSGQDAQDTFVNNLIYACAKADGLGLTCLIEPLNAFDAPGYFLNNLQQAEQLIEALQLPNLKLMFDCYHVQRTEGEVVENLKRLMPLIGHIQFAGVPDRGEPDRGNLDYSNVFECLAKLGYSKPLGAEYKSIKPTDETLAWMELYD